MMDFCPKCGKHYKGRPALSRRDNKTNICPACGMMEALEDAGKVIENKTIKEKEDN